MQAIQLVDRALDQCCDDACGLGIDDRILAICVQQHFVQAILHGMRADELRSLRSDFLFKSVVRSLMICRAILLCRVAGQAFGGASNTVGRRFIDQNFRFLSCFEISAEDGFSGNRVSIYCTFSRRGSEAVISAQR